MNKVSLKIITVLLLLSNFIVKAQSPLPIDSLEGFDQKEFQHHLNTFTGTEKEKEVYIQRVKRRFIDQKYKSGTFTPPTIPYSARGSNPGTQTNCTNIDFESGNTSGWTVTGANQIMSGAGVDPFGNFPVVYPGGNYSLRLSDNNLSTPYFSSQASRVINVTAGNTFFNLHFAMCILDYPHSQADAARLTIQFFNSSGVLLNCPQYECYYYVDAFGNGQAVGINSFQQTWGSTTGMTGPGVNLGGQNFPVTYATWQTVGMDLLPFVGQNVTCVVTCKWCVYNYDWAYCYIDADCPISNVVPPNTCLSLPTSLCGPPGMDTYAWTAPPGNSVPTATTTCINATVAGVYTVACSVTTCSTSIYTYTYNVQPGPTASFTNTTANCTGNISFTSTSSTNGGAPITTYTWNWGDGTPNGSGASATHVFGTVGSNTVTLIISNGTCTDSITGVVTVPPHPIPNFNLTNNCLNSVSSFTSTSTSTAGINSQIWEYGDATANGSGGTPSHTYASPGTYNVTLIITDNNLCVDSITKPITIYPPPIINVSNGTVCNGASVTLTATGASTYVWSPPTGLSATTGASVTANPPSTTNYTITGTDINGCVNTNTTTVTVVTNPTVTVNAAAICLGQQTATLTANGAGTYAWSPATGLSSTAGTSVTATPASTTVYTITGSAGTCTSVATTTVTVNPLPLPVAGSNSPVCVNQVLNLTSSGGTGYSWTGPNTFSSAQQNPSITGVTMPAAGVYTVTVTDANTCTSSTTVNVVINPLPIVTVTGATVCLGATINLTSSGGTGYSWSGPGVYSSNQQNPSITNATLAMSGSYVVVVTDANGCSNANAAQVTVNPSLVIVAGSNSPVCQNATLNLTASTGVQWTWSGPNVYSSNQQNPSINNAQPNVSGTYTVVATDANGCQGTATILVTVNPLPIVTASSATICAGAFGTMNATGATTYTWNTGGTGSSPSLSPPSTTSYTVVGTDNNGCVNFGTSAITVNALPVVAVNSGVICIGNATTLTALGATNYIWNPATGLSSGVGNIVSANPITTTVYTITGTDLNGCVNTAVSTVTVNPLPIIQVTSTVICVGSPGTLNASGASTYAWSPATGLSSTTGASVVANPATTSAYTVTGTDINSCLNTATLAVTVNPLPLVTVGPQNTSGCAPVCVSFSNTAAGTGTCNWNFGNGTTSNSCAPTNCFMAQGTFNISLTITDNNGCVNSSTASVTVYPVPHADFSFSPQPTTILNPQINFQDLSNGATLTNWNWTFGNPGNSSSVVQNPIYTYTEPGSYPVELYVISDHGCKDSIIKIVIIEEDYFLYVPNAFSPNGDEINEVFMAKGEGIKDFKMYIFDRWGNQIFYSDDIYKGWDGRYQSKGTDVVQEDVYVWKIEAKNIKGEPRLLKGIVSLIR